MKILNYTNYQIMVLLKKGRKVKFLLPFFISLMLISCGISNPSRYGRVTPHNTANVDSFTFSVTEKFVKKYSDSKKDKKNPLITKSEKKLLTSLLKEKNYCMKHSYNPSFVITSKQEKIYDVTFAHLIEKNYNAQPLTPRMYFGKCSQ